MTRNECELIAFYKSLYSSYLIEDDNVFFIKNNHFDNPIMSPCFMKSDSLSEESRDLMVQNRIDWINSFRPLKNRILGKRQKLILRPFYVFERERIICERDNNIPFISTSYKGLSNRELSEFTQALVRNTPSLTSEIHHEILKVLISSDARIEFLIGRDENSCIVAGVTQVHGERGTLLVNGFIDHEKRSSGLFKEFHAFNVNHALNSGQEYCFYWTFNDKLKYRTKDHMKLYVYSF